MAFHFMRLFANVLSKKRNDMKDKIFEVVKNHTENEETAMQLTNELCVLLGVSKRCLADIEIEYKHPTGKKKGKLKYDDDDETLILDYKGGFITLPNIEDCNVC